MLELVIAVVVALVVGLLIGVTSMHGKVRKLEEGAVTTEEEHDAFYDRVYTDLSCRSTYFVALWIGNKTQLVTCSVDTYVA